MSSTKSILWEQVKGLMSLTNLDETRFIFVHLLKTNMMRHHRLFTTFCRVNPAMLPRKCHKRQNRFSGGQNRTMESDLQINVGKCYAFRIEFNSASKFAIAIKQDCYGSARIERVNFVFSS